MKAIVYDRYGTPDVLRLEEVPTPAPAEGQARIRILAVSINGSDREGLIGRPLYSRFGGLFRPGERILGSDIAGVVDAVGENHSEFKPGDEVYGEIPGYHGGFAEYACTHGRTMARKPENLSFAEAAAIPQGGVIAWNGIRKRGRVQAGQRVLINGAGGSAGVFAVQLARLAGAAVTAVDNASKLDFLRDLGADEGIDYRREDFTRSGKTYDLILDLIAQRPASACARALNPGGTYFYVGGPISILFQILLLGPFFQKTRNRHLKVLSVPQNREDLGPITQLCLEGKVQTVIDKRFALEEVPQAMRYVVEGRARGKVVIIVGDGKNPG